MSNPFQAELDSLWEQVEQIRKDFSVAYLAGDKELAAEIERAFYDALAAIHRVRELMAKLDIPER
ncbi:MAG: hypothetical protein JSV86_09145 [Gemmatimonadota bacterium]|nr:MAG: hypothetical protein JSV86_09145 [Gemmatimonadota bacterium]